MTDKLLICIPTYGIKIKNRLMIVRLLNSLASLPSKDFRVVILNNNYPYNEKVTENINKACAGFSEHFPVMQVTQYDVDFLRNMLLGEGFNGALDHISMKGFSNFRNIMLIVARALREKILFMIDDDEVVEDRMLIKKAPEFIGKKVRGRFLYGKTGYYINSNNTPYLFQQSPKRRRLWLKETYINEALRNSITRKPRLNESTMAFGGAMVLHERLFSKVPFDPNITRGEDTDYAINAKQFGFSFLMDKNLRLNHLPPKKNIKYWDKLRQDIYRYIYEKEKLKYFNRIHIRSLEPYPATFLKDDLEYRAVCTSIGYARSALKRKDHDFYKESFRNVEIIFKDAKINAVVNAPRYFEFQKHWVHLMDFVRKSKKLRKHFGRFE